MILVAALAGLACHAEVPRRTGTAAALRSRRTANLHAFARLYGALRWFHPSDAGAAIDWDRFATDGVRRVIDAPDSRALRSAFVDLIAPVAPTVHLALGDESFRPGPGRPPEVAGALESVAWEHVGYGDSSLVSAYASKRRHRARRVAVPAFPFAALSQVVDAAAVRGRRVRLRGKLRTADHGLGRLFMRVDRGEHRGFFDNMREHPLVGATWVTAEIAGTVDADATRIVFGTIMSGGGTVWYDDLQLEAEAAGGRWQPIEVKDPGFEAADLFASWSPGTASTSAASLEGWSATLDHAYAASGRTSLRVEPVTRTVTDELFADAPGPDETIDVDLGQGLRARVPLSLYSVNGHTIGDDPEAARRSQAGRLVTPTAGFDAAGGIADVIVVWNALEHFWPYWDVSSADWLAELDAAIGDALDDRSVDDHVTTLRRLSAAAADGHADTVCPGEAARTRPPFVVDLVEGQLVVTATSDKALSPGDLVISIDGVPATRLLAAGEALASGSPQRRLERARLQLGAGPAGTSMHLRVRRRDAELEVTMVRDGSTPDELAHPHIERLDDGVYYVNLGRASMADLNAIMERLATAPGIVFDLRGYPNSNHEILAHLLTHPVDISEGMTIPHIIRPDHTPASVATWQAEITSFPPLPPHISGRVAFVTGPGAISYAESVMEIVEQYHLGAIVGGPTAGTNGNIAEIATPTGCRVAFTGMRVTKSDGARLYLVGVQPTIRASRTIAGVLAGRDEALETALAHVRDTR